ncbi:MAG: DsbA family oxidoreductase [Saprospiraceae bacterium]|jgi:predicted DsbA family dithiol-disulfide isomerase|nr:DsbA family oxidoreductase [Saprospiraceae bacterium]
MKVEIWSDIMCPFCYIGKRHFEQALNSFDNKDKVEVEWKSFQLDPEIPEIMVETKSVYDYVAERKGMSMEDSRQLHDHVVFMAHSAGLDYHFEKTIVANSLKAHRIIQKAKELSLGDPAEEVFFKAYFTEGKNLADNDTLVALGKEIGLSQEQTIDALNNDNYSYAVHQDIQEGSRLGVRGVPFFVFDRKYGISGAQPVEAFTHTLQQSYDEWAKENAPSIQMTSSGEACSIDGNCD